MSISPVWSSEFAENATKVGPVGGVFASIKALRIKEGICSG